MYGGHYDGKFHQSFISAITLLSESAAPKIGGKGNISYVIRLAQDTLFGPIPGRNPAGFGCQICT